MIIIDISFGFRYKETTDKLTWELLNIGRTGQQVLFASAIKNQSCWKLESTCYEIAWILLQI